MQQIELRYLGERRVRLKRQAAGIANRRCRFPINPVAGMRKPRYDFERSGQINLIEALEQQRPDQH